MYRPISAVIHYKVWVGATWFLQWKVRIPQRAWIFVCCVCCVLCRQRIVRRADRNLIGQAWGVQLCKNFQLVCSLKRGATPPLPHIRLVACTNNCTFWNPEQFNFANSCCAVCHNLCYSYSPSLATFSPLTAPSIQRTISILYSTSIIQSACSCIFTYC
jgi:hypothetical protein